MQPGPTWFGSAQLDLRLTRCAIPDFTDIITGILESLIITIMTYIIKF